MKTTNVPDIIADDVVVTMDYTLTVDGVQMGSSKQRKPIEFIQGQHEIVPGLEQNIYNMKAGDSKEIKVEAANGYGKIDPDDFLTMQKTDFPENIPLDPGTIISLRDEAGGSQKARIDSATEDEVRLNFNHPLAGKELLFHVDILELRTATPEEIESGLA